MLKLSNMEKIIAAQIVGRGKCDMVVTLSNGTQVTAFSYFDDELSFMSSEVVGMTLEQAHELHIKKDTEYLRN